MNARVLQHRAVIESMLSLVSTAESQRDRRSQSELHRSVDDASNQVERSMACAEEIINTVWTLRVAPELVGAWWFSAYYSEKGFPYAIGRHSCLTSSSLQCWSHALRMCTDQIQNVE